jgi:hypothetical protein
VYTEKSDIFDKDKDEKEMGDNYAKVIRNRRT